MMMTFKEEEDEDEEDELRTKERLDSSLFGTQIKTTFRRRRQILAARSFVVSLSSVVLKVVVLS